MIYTPAGARTFVHSHERVVAAAGGVFVCDVPNTEVMVLLVTGEVSNEENALFVLRAGENVVASAVLSDFCLIKYLHVL